MSDWNTEVSLYNVPITPSGFYNKYFQKHIIVFNTNKHYITQRCLENTSEFIIRILNFNILNTYCKLNLFVLLFSCIVHNTIILSKHLTK